MEPCWIDTARLKFGHERGQFGRWMPGKQITACTVEDIPSPTSIGPYRNIILHTGINNIKIHNRRSCKSLADEIERKCDEVFSVYPRCKIFLSLALPTKSDLLNHRVREFNMLLDLAHNYRRINVIETSSVADRYGILIDEFGRFDKRAGKYMDHDILQLVIRGLIIFAKSVKDTVINSRNINSSQVVQGYQGQGRSAAPNHSKRGQSLPPQSQR